MPDLGKLAPSSLLELSDSKLAEFNVGVGRDRFNPVIIKKWQVIQDPSTPKQRFRFLVGGINAQVKRDSGTSSVTYGFYTSQDGTNYNDQFLRVTTSSTSYQALDSGSGDFFIDDDDLFWIIGAFSNDASTSGTVRNAISSLIFQIPPGYTIKRLI